MRPLDIVGRFGGEEFAVLLPETDSEGAILVGQRIMQLLAQEAIPHGKSSFGRVTISIGVATTSGLQAISPEALIKAADEVLYSAKAAGRNQLKSISLSDS